MAIQEMSLPVDIAWKRLAASADMMDQDMNDSQLPPRWRSSLAIFYADAEEADPYCDRIITYVKVVCTITGYQLGEQELGYGFEPPPLDASTVETPRNFGFELPLEMLSMRASGGTWQRVARGLGFGRANKPAKELTLVRTIGLADGQRFVSSAEQITQNLQLSEGSLREPPSVSVTPQVVTVELKPAKGAAFKGSISCQVAETLESWGTQTIERFRTTVGAYRPCHGAMLQVAVYPGKKDDKVSLEHYPYIVGFEPKKRELYEAVTDSGEMASASSSNVNVRKGTTSTSQTEDLSVLTGIQQEFKWAGTGGSGEITGELGTRERRGTENVNITTTDTSREKRESLAHTTSLTQLYTLLQSYHLATNRSLFLMLPRPHQRQQFFSFANGPRELEGVQEFFLVVSRPKSIRGLCVSALLETAHVIDEERTQIVGAERYDEFILQKSIDVQHSGNGWHSEPVTIPLPGGYILDWSRTNRVVIWDWVLYDYGGEYASSFEVVESDFSVQVIIRMYDDDDDPTPTRVRCKVAIYCVSVEPIEVPREEQWVESDLVITARRVAGCVNSTKAGPLNEDDEGKPPFDDSLDNAEANEDIAEPSSDLSEDAIESSSDDNSHNSTEEEGESSSGLVESAAAETTGRATDSEVGASAVDSDISEPLGEKDELDGEDWLTYETTIAVVDDREADSRLGRHIRVANLMIPRVAQAMIESIGSPNRHKLGESRIGEAQYIAREFARVLARLPENHPANRDIKDLVEEVPERVADRIRQLNIRKASDLARNLRILENSIRDPDVSRALQEIVLSAAGFQPKSKDRK